VKELELGSTNVILIDDDALQFAVPEDTLPECAYRRVSEQETDDLQAKLPDYIKARTLEFGPDCPPEPGNMHRDVEFV